MSRISNQKNPYQDPLEDPYISKDELKKIAAYFKQKCESLVAVNTQMDDVLKWILINHANPAKVLDIPAKELNVISRNFKQSCGISVQYSPITSNITLEMVKNDERNPLNQDLIKKVDWVKFTADYQKLIENSDDDNLPAPDSNN